MRLIQATVPGDRLGDVRAALDGRDIDYYAVEERASPEYAAVLYVSLPDEDVETVLHELYEAGLDSTDHVVVLDSEVDVYGRTGDEKNGFGEYERIVAAELEGKSEDLIPDVRTFLTTLTLSSIVATMGLLLGSAAVVVGAMVLAPLFGPAITTSIGTVVDEGDLFRRGVRFQVTGVAVAIGSAAAVAWVMKVTYLTPVGFTLVTAPQIVGRTSPDLLSLTVALAAGLAGVLSLASDSGRTLVGVVIAAALLPPAATVGIGIAWWQPVVAINSGVLLLANLLAINFAGLLALWYLGRRSGSWVRILQTRTSLWKHATVLSIAILVTAAFLGQVTYASVQRSRTENAVDREVSAVLEDEAYENATLVGVKVLQDRTRLSRRTERVVVTIGRPPGRRYPDLHRRIDRIVARAVGRDVTVDMRISLVVEDPDRRFRLAPTSVDRGNRLERRPA